MDGVSNIISNIQPVQTEKMPCVVCGQSFDAQVNSEVKCCSEPCRRIYRRRNKQDAFLSSCNVPKRFQGVSGKLPKKILSACGPFIYLYGYDKGPGKTYKAVQRFYHELITLPLRYGLYVNSMDLFDNLKTALSDYSEKAEKILNKYASTDVLLLDDFGTERITWYVAEKTYRLIERRSSNNLLTIITSNKSIREYVLAFPEVVTDLGDKVAGRIGEGQQIKIAGNNKRLTEKE